MKQTPEEFYHQLLIRVNQCLEGMEKLLTTYNEDRKMLVGTLIVLEKLQKVIELEQEKTEVQSDNSSD